MGLLRRVRHTFSSRDEDFGEEMRFHIERRVEDLIAGGLSPDEARRTAARQFGNDASLRERTRDADSVRWLSDLSTDVRYGMRTLVRNPGFAVVAVLTLALGIGANTAVFAAAYGVLLRPLPYAGASQIVRLSEFHENAVSPLRDDFISDWTFDAWRRDGKTLESLGAYAERAFTVTGSGDAERVRGALLSPEISASSGRHPRPAASSRPTRRLPARSTSPSSATTSGSGSCGGRTGLRRAVDHARRTVVRHRRRRAGGLLVPRAGPAHLHAVRRAATRPEQPARRRDLRDRSAPRRRERRTGGRRRHVDRPWARVAAGGCRPAVRQGRPADGSCPLAGRPDDVRGEADSVRCSPRVSRWCCCSRVRTSRTFCSRWASRASASSLSARRSAPGEDGCCDSCSPKACRCRSSQRPWASSSPTRSSARGPLLCRTASHVSPRCDSTGAPLVFALALSLIASILVGLAPAAARRARQSRLRSAGRARRVDGPAQPPYSSGTADPAGRVCRRPGRWRGAAGSQLRSAREPRQRLRRDACAVGARHAARLTHSGREMATARHVHRRARGRRFPGSSRQAFRTWRRWATRR